jgi:hypothetical protein
MSLETQRFYIELAYWENLSIKTLILYFPCFTSRFIKSCGNFFLQQTLMDTPKKRKAHKGGGIVRTEPYDMQLFYSETLIREVFQSVGCINFYQKKAKRAPRGG